MKKMSFILVCALLASFNYKASADVVRKEITLTLSGAFVPEFVDEDQDAKVVLTGMYPNSCYSWSRAEVTKVTPMDYSIQAKAMVVTSAKCLMYLTPFLEEVNLGRLPAGEHIIHFINGDETIFDKKLTVR